MYRTNFVCASSGTDNAVRSDGVASKWNHTFLEVVNASAHFLVRGSSDRAESRRVLLSCPLALPSPKKVTSAFTLLSLFLWTGSVFSFRMNPLDFAGKPVLRLAVEKNQQLADTENNPR